MAAPRLNYLWLEITEKCNLECVHCYADSGPARPLKEKLSLADWLSALGQASALGCRSVQFIGGEPTLHPDLPRLIAEARAFGFTTIEVYTNGTCFTTPVREALSRHRVNLAFSVYSSEGSAHDAVVRQAGSLERTLESIRWAVKERLPVRVGLIEMEENRGHAERTTKILKEMGVGLVGVDKRRGVGRGGASSSDPLRELCGHCILGRLCVTASGAIYPCVFSRFRPVGRFEDGLARALGGKTMEDFYADMARIGWTPKRFKTAVSCNPGAEPGPGPCQPEVPPPPDPCEPNAPLPCDPMTPTPPVPCDPNSPLPCDPMTPPVPCGPQTPTPPDPCDPNAPLPCDPMTPQVPCDPETPPAPDPNQLQAGPGAAVRKDAHRQFPIRLAILSDDPDPCTPDQDPGPCTPDQDPGPCNPDQNPGPCQPDQNPGPCSPDQDPGPCNPDKDPGPCTPDQDPGKCNPEIDPGPCDPDKPSICEPETPQGE